MPADEQYFHDDRSAMSRADIELVTAMNERLRRMERQVRHLTSLVPEKDRVPPPDVEDAPPVVVSVGQRLDELAAHHLAAELDAKSKLPPASEERPKELDKGKSHSGPRTGKHDAG